VVSAITPATLTNAVLDLRVLVRDKSIMGDREFKVVGAES
jgi:hypothetical protein